MLDLLNMPLASVLCASQYIMKGPILQTGPALYERVNI